MSKTRKNWAIIIVMVLAVSLLLPSVVMKVKASGTATANLTINFMESIGDNPDGSTNKEVTITNFVSNEESGTFDGTINLVNENITYEKNSGDTRYIIEWYTMSEDGTYIPVNSTFSLSEVQVEEGDGVYHITLYAVYGKTIEITFNNNYANYGGSYNDNIKVSKYYPQSAEGEASKTITLPANPESEFGAGFMIDGYSFTGWGAKESGETEMVNSATMNYESSTTYYAYWENLRPQGPIVEAGQYYLEPNTQYILGDGTWTVNGGATEYSGRIGFYVKQSGTYTLSKQ